MATPTTSTGTATPLELDPEQAAKSLKVSLADLSAKATALYAQKNYEEAAETYAHAAEMQAEMNGEMDPENAEILFLYGRALFQVGQSKSEVLGAGAPVPKKQKSTQKAKSKTTNGSANPQNGESSTSAAVATETKVDEAVSEAAAKIAEKKEKEEPGPEIKKPLFHFEGDDDLVDSDEEEEAEEGGEEEEEDEDHDDLASAFVILDMARVLFEKKLESLEKAGSEAPEGSEPTIKHIKERLGDTHDLLAEIELENERFLNAAADSRSSLKYKQSLYPPESEIIAEAHFKLSLALEFASVTKQSDENDKEAENATVDQALRDEAAVELQAAIDSTKLKLRNKELDLATVHNPEDNDVSRREITDIKEILADMEARLVELRKPPFDINAALGIPARPASSADNNNGLEKGVSEEVRKNANDLTGLVRKKRKAEDTAEVAADADGQTAKKARSDDGQAGEEVAMEE